MSNREIPDREKQRQMIMLSDLFLSGEEFNSADALKMIGVPSLNTANLLIQMARDGLVHSRKVKRGSKTWIYYSRKPSQLARRAWRRHSDSQIGITV